MGTFEYQCERGHITEWFGKHDEKPERVECQGGDGDSPCLEHADPIISAVPTTFRAMDRKAFKRRGR